MERDAQLGFGFYEAPSSRLPPLLLGLWCHSAIGARPPAQPVLVLTGTLTLTTLGLLAPYKEAPAWPCFPQPERSAQVKPESRQLAAGTEIQLVVADVSHFESWDLVRRWSGAPCCSKLWSAATQVAKPSEAVLYKPEWRSTV